MTSPIEEPTVLVGYDASPAAREAVRHAVGLTGLSGTLIVAHVCPIPDEYAGTPYRADVAERAAERADEALDALELEVPELAALGYERQVVHGRPARALVQLAELHGADILVLGSRGHGRLRALLGSVAADVIHRAPCPVYVIPQRVAAEAAGGVRAAGMVA